eukprot:bmy_15103T0
MAEGSGEVVAVPATGAANGLNNGAGGTSAQINNPLSRKLRKILDTRLDNDKELESIHEDVQAMSSCCQDMTCRLQAAKEQTQDLITKTTKLQAESQTLEIRAQVADAFLSKFQLSSDEMSLLRGTREGPITEVFCFLLKSLKALEIMEQMALLQETSYERLYRWAQSK